MTMEIQGAMNAEQAEQMMDWVRTPEGQAAMHEHVKAVMAKVRGPEGVKEFYGTEWVDGESKTFEQRLSRCYELAAYALVFGTAPKGAKLIHGSMHGPGGARRIGHGWLRLPGGKVWEPIAAKVYDEKEWIAWVDGRVERVYPKGAAVRQLHLTENFGRWHTSRYP